MPDNMTMARCFFESTRILWFFEYLKRFIAPTAFFFGRLKLRLR